MAKAEPVTIMVTPPVPAPIPVQHVRLLLTKEEAAVLCHLSMKVGGDPNESRRGVLDKIREAIIPHIPDPYATSDIEGAMTFRNSNREN